MKFWQKRKGAQGLIEIENPNLVKPKNLKARDVDVSLAYVLDCNVTSVFCL